MIYSFCSTKSSLPKLILMIYHVRTQSRSYFIRVLRFQQGCISLWSITYDSTQEQKRYKKYKFHGKNSISVFGELSIQMDSELFSGDYCYCLFNDYPAGTSFCSSSEHYWRLHSYWSIFQWGSYIDSFNPDYY